MDQADNLMMALLGAPVDSLTASRCCRQRRKSHSIWVPVVVSLTCPVQGILSTATSDLLEVVPASFGGTARVLVGTGRYHDPVIVDGWSGYQFERNQVCTLIISWCTRQLCMTTRLWHYRVCAHVTQ